MTKSKLHPKVAASSLSGALTIVTLGIATRSGLDLSPTEAGALVVLATSAAGWAKSA